MIGSSATTSKKIVKKNTLIRACLFPPCVTLPDSVQFWQAGLKITYLVPPTRTEKCILCLGNKLQGFCTGEHYLRRVENSSVLEACLSKFSK
jgi:hypothetical protein